MQLLPPGPFVPNQGTAPVAQLAEATGLNPVQCRCKSGREHLRQPLSPY